MTRATDTQELAEQRAFKRGVSSGRRSDVGSAGPSAVQDNGLKQIVSAALSIQSLELVRGRRHVLIKLDEDQCTAGIDLVID